MIEFDKKLSANCHREYFNNNKINEERQMKMVEFDKNLPCRVIKSGNVIEVMQMSIQPEQLRAPIRKMDKNHYIDLRTGEVKRYVKRTYTRATNLQTLRRTMRKMRRIINSNFYGEQNECMVTLTYAENMRDHLRCYKDIKAFTAKWRRRYGYCEYITILEPQKRGAWHAHILIKTENMPDWTNEMERLEACIAIHRELWPHGRTDIRRLTNIDNVGAYLTSYLTSFKTNDKKRKGDRLHRYPAGMRIFRASNGLKRPETYTQVTDEIETMTQQLEPQYSTEYDIEKTQKDGQRKVIQHIKYIQYNLKKPRIDPLFKQYDNISNQFIDTHLLV